jgi:transposase InsO family protein
MSQARVAVLKVVTGQLSVTTAAAQYGYSRQHLHRLLARYREGGLDAVDPRSRRPHGNTNATSPQVRDLSIELRLHLAREGLDAGPVTVAWHLEQRGHRAPSTSTIRRVLHAAGLIVPEPRKRPRSSYRRFEAAQPHECWQSDFTHWRLADGTDTEILNWLDDHSRYLLACTTHAPVTGDIVVEQFLTTCNTHGIPASHADRQRPGLHRPLRRREERLRVHPRRAQGHPEERQTEPPADPRKSRTPPPDPETVAGRQPPATTLAELQAQLDRFREIYNNTRPHRSLDRATPASVCTTLPKATPSDQPTAGHYRLRYDRVDTWGKISMRRAGRIHHLGVGYAHRGTRVLAIADHTTVTVIDLTPGEILSTPPCRPRQAPLAQHTKSPRPLAGSPINVTHVPTQVSPMSRLITLARP